LPVIPAKAGIQFLALAAGWEELNPSLRWDDGLLKGSPERSTLL